MGEIQELNTNIYAHYFISFKRNDKSFNLDNNFERIFIRQLK